MTVACKLIVYATPQSSSLNTRVALNTPQLLVGAVNVNVMPLLVAELANTMNVVAGSPLNTHGVPLDGF